MNRGENPDPDQTIQAIDAERAQIANEVHDQLLPLIVGTRAILVSHLDSDVSQHADREKLQTALRWLGDALSTGRELLVQSYPPELSQTTWTKAAHYTASSILGDKCSLDWQVDSACDAFPQPVAATAYRIVVEAVRNAVRHGKAKTVMVVADKDRVTITDDGKGFDPDLVSNDRFGIRSMQGRATLVGGDVQIHSQPGGPTEVRFQVTLEC